MSAILKGRPALAALGIGSLGERNRRDVATAFGLVTLLALGSLFLSFSGGYEPEVYALLFGEILGVSTTALWPIAAVGLGCLIALGRPRSASC
jgi:zinc/manganese transport system permease protein